MNTLQQIEKLAQESLVTTRNHYKYTQPEIMEKCIKSLNKLQAVRLLVDLLGLNLVQCREIIDSVINDDISFTDAMNKHVQ